MKNLFGWLLPKRKKRHLGTVKLGDELYSLSDDSALDEYLQRLPGFSQGIPAIPVALMVKKNEALIDQIILARGVSGGHNKALAEKMVMSAVNRLAEMTHLLPASENQHFKYPGGLFTFCLEVALTSIHYAERRILTRATPEVRREYEDLWAQAAFLNGLYNEAIAVLSRVSVYVPTADMEWHPGTDLLNGWLVRNKIDRYLIRWSGQEDRSKIHVLAGKAIDHTQADILSKGEWAIYNTLHGALHDRKDFKNPLAKINDQVRYKIMERDIWSRAESYGKPLAGMHLETWLVDAMRYLLQRRRWSVNGENGRVWYGADGLFLVWPLSANDLQFQLRESECPFVPWTEEILADIMLDAGMIERSEGLNGYLHEIAVPVVDSTDNKYLDAVKLVRTETLFAKSVPPDPLGMDLLVGAYEGQVQKMPLPEPQEQPTPESIVAVGLRSNSEGVVQVVESGGGHDISGKMDLFSAAGVYGDEYAADYAGRWQTPMQPISQALSVEAGADVDEPSMALLLDSLIGSPINQQPASVAPSRAADRGEKNPTGLPGNLDGRLLQLLNRLKDLPNGCLEPQPGGITKVSVHGLKAVDMELNACVALLKEAGLLVLANGLETGLATPGKPASRFFLVKAELLHGS